MRSEMPLQSQAQRREGLTELREGSLGTGLGTARRVDLRGSQGLASAWEVQLGLVGGGGGPACHSRVNIEGTYRWKGKKGDAD